MQFLSGEIIKMPISRILRVDVVRLKCGREGRIVSGHWADKDGEVISELFIFDGASSPWFLWVIIPPFKDLEKSCRHDWDCKKARVVMKRGGKKNKKTASKIRKAGDKRYGHGIAKTRGRIIGFIAYCGVRIGSLFGSGWKHLNYEVIE